MDITKLNEDIVGMEGFKNFSWTFLWSIHDFCQFLVSSLLVRHALKSAGNQKIRTSQARSEKLVLQLKV